jgi:NAD(P)H-hydrate epimerase
MTGFAPVYDAAEMRTLDARAIGELGIPGAVLMERAGLAAAAEIHARHPHAGRVAVVCGSGNNAGDGLVVARHLQAAGIAVDCLFPGDPAALRGDAAVNRDVAARLGIELRGGLDRSALSRRLRGAGLVVDALLGTGARGRPRPPADAAIAAIERSRLPVVSLDIPSGVDSSTGEVEAEAVHAGCTVTFHAAKVGLLVSPGRHHAGEVAVAGIGIPPALVQPTAIELADEGVLDLVPARPAGATKYTAGSVLVVGGSAGYAGAPLMAATAAMRAGAGLVWAVVAPEVCEQLAGRRPELIVRPLPAGIAAAERAGALAIGPGMGDDGAALELAGRLARDHPGPVVLDADGLRAVAGRELARLAARAIPAVLTPHEGEMGRLLGWESGRVRAHRLEAVRAAAERSGAVVLLKGPDTLVAAPAGGRLAIVSNELPELATAGSGDVLTGVISALLARGLAPFEAAVAGAVAHGRAGRLAVGRIGGAGIIAGDVIDALPAAFER